MLPLIVLFAKAPVPGRVKTRLELDPRRAAGLHSSFVQQTLAMLESLRGEADVELSTDEPTPAWGGFPVARSVQAAGQLGERIYAALDRALAAGRPKVMILGSDSPGLPPAHIRALLGSAADVSIGPVMMVDSTPSHAAERPRQCSRAFDGLPRRRSATRSSR